MIPSFVDSFSLSCRPRKWNWRQLWWMKCKVKQARADFMGLRNITVFLKLPFSVFKKSLCMYYVYVSELLREIYYNSVSIFFKYFLTLAF